MSPTPVSPDQQRAFLVGGALIVQNDCLLLVANRRRQGHLEWTPPGGVIDAGETTVEGIAREVAEETGLTIDAWDQLQYSVVVSAADMGWRMSVQCWTPIAIDGSIVLDDPDGIVEQARWVPLNEVDALLINAPKWVRVPVNGWIRAGCQPLGHYQFALHGADRSSANVVQL